MSWVASRPFESAKHCEYVFALDPCSYISGLRFCAVAYLLLDDYPRTINFLRLDQGSDFERALLNHLDLLKGERVEALRLGAARIPQWGTFEMLRECAAG